MGYFVASSMESVAAQMKEKRTPLQESDKKQPWPALVFRAKMNRNSDSTWIDKKGRSKKCCGELCSLSFQPQGEDSRKETVECT